MVSLYKDWDDLLMKSHFTNTGVIFRIKHLLGPDPDLNMFSGLIKFTTFVTLELNFGA